MFGGDFGLLPPSGRQCPGGVAHRSNSNNANVQSVAGGCARQDSFPPVYPSTTHQALLEELHIMQEVSRDT